MKKIFALALALMMVLAAFAGCANDATEPTETPVGTEAPEGTEAPATTDNPDAAEPAEGETLIIGGIGPLTGDYATYGVSVKQGAEMAVKEINEAGGVNGITPMEEGSIP